MTRRQWMWLWIWLLLLLIIFCVWNKLQSIKNVPHKVSSPVTTVSQKQPKVQPTTSRSDIVQQKDMMLKLIKENDILRLSGVFPSENAVEKALKTLTDQGYKVERGAIIIDPYTNNQQLLSVIAQFGENLGKFDGGSIEYKEHTVTVNGMVESNEAKEEIAASLAKTGKDYKIQNNLQIKSPPKSVAPAPVKENAVEKNTTALSLEELKKAQAEKAQKEKEAELQKVQKTLNDILKHKRVEFVYAKEILTPKSRKIIDQIVEILKEHPNVNVEIGGHTDSNGDAKRNLKLSQRRAEAVKRYLVKKGIAESRLIAKGYGENKPLVKNDTETNRQTNRRVEFKVINIEGEEDG